MSEQVTGTGSGARVGIVMGSDSDWPVMQAAAEACREFDVEIEADVVSAHRMPHEMLAYGEQAAERGLSVIIAGAGGAAHLPGMLAAVTPLPVIGVPVPLKYLDGMDSLLSIVQMPAGVPVATVAVGNARNAGLLVIALDTPLDPIDAADMTFATDNFLAGELIGQWAAAKLGDWQIVDARSAARFKGEAPEPREGLRSGHIPNSRNVPFTDLLDADGTMKDEEGLKAVFEAAGVDLAKPVISSCGSGVTAAIIDLALARLGHPRHAIYDGSWAEWGMYNDLKIATGDA